MKHPPYSETGVSLHYTGAFLDARGNRNLPRFRKGILADLALAEKPYRAVNARDHDAERQGLKEFLRLETTDGKPIYIVDEHHHALFAWVEALSEGVIQSGATLIHVDEHSDAWEEDIESLPIGFSPTHPDLAQIRQYIQNELHEGKFMHSALLLGIVKDIYHVSPTTTRKVLDTHYFPWLVEIGMNSKILQTAKSGKVTNIILDIDIDYFLRHTQNSRELLEKRGQSGSILLEKDMEVLRRLIKTADLITIATSPSYINQKLALELINQLLDGQTK